MSVTSLVRSVSYPGAGTTGPFSYGFKIYAKTDLAVYRDDTLLTHITDYTVADSGVANPQGGTITLVVALAVGETLTIERVMPLLQGTDLKNQGNYHPQTIEDQFDRQIMIAQQHDARITDVEQGGGAALPLTSRGDIMQRGASGNDRLAIGTAGQVPTVTDVGAGALELRYAAPGSALSKLKHVAATTVARDALSGLEANDLIGNVETGEVTRWDGTKHVPWTNRADGRLYAAAFGATPTTPRLGNPVVNSWGAVNAMLLSCLSAIEPSTFLGKSGVVASASNNDGGHTTLTKTSSELTWTAGDWADVRYTGTVTSADATSVTDSAGAFAESLPSAILRFTGGNQVGKCVHIDTNTTTQISFGGQDLSPVPSVGSTFEVIRTRDPVAGYGDVAFEVAIVEGKGQGQWAIIVANDVGKLYLDRKWAANHIPDSTSRFKILAARCTTARYVDAPGVLPTQTSLIDMTEFGHLDGAAGCQGFALRGGSDSNLGTILKFRGGKAKALCTTVTITDTSLADSSVAWTVDQWKGWYLVCWTPHLSRPWIFIPIKSNTATALQLDQANWPGRLVSTISVVTNAHRFTAPGLNGSGAFDNHRFGRVRITTKSGVEEARYITAMRVDFGDNNDFTINSDLTGTALASVSVVSIDRVGAVATAVTGTNHNRSTGEWVYISGATETEYNGLVQITFVNVTSFSYTVAGTPATPATGTIIAGDRVIVDDAPSTNWHYAIASSYAFELNGTTQHKVKNFTVQIEAGSEVLTAFGHSWRRGVGGTTDGRRDPRRCARSSSDNEEESINIVGNFIHCGIMLGNFLSGANNQVDNVRGTSLRVQGSVDPDNPDSYHHWGNGIIAGGGSFGNALAKVLRSPVVIGCYNGVVNSYDDLRVTGALIQTCVNDLFVAGTSNYTIYEGGRSEGSTRLYYAPFGGATAQHVTLRGIGFKQDGPYQCPDGGIIYDGLQGILRVEDVHSLSGFNSGNDGVVTAADAGGAWIEATNASLTFPLANGALNTEWWLVIKTGTGAGQFKRLSGGVVVTAGTVRVNVQGTFATVPGVGATFEIVSNNYGPIQGTFTASPDFTIGSYLNISETFIEYNGDTKTWGHAPERHRDKQLIVTSGALAGTSKTIQDNSRDRLFMKSGQNLGSAPAAGDTFIITQGRHTRIISTATFGVLHVDGFATFAPKDRLIYVPGNKTARVLYYDRADYGPNVVETWVGGVRFDVDGWYHDDTAAGLTNQTMTRIGGPSYAPNTWIARRAGHVTGLWVKSNEARTAGTLTVKLFKNGVVMTSEQYAVTEAQPNVVLNATDTTFATKNAKGWMDWPFEEGDQIDLRITTDAGWLPITADLGAGISVELAN